MLTKDVERYLSIRRSLGFKLANVDLRLRSFARVASLAGESRIRADTAIRWAAAAPSPDARRRRIQEVAILARFLRAEDPAHEVPRTDLFFYRRTRPTPYIYTRQEVERLLLAASQLQPNRRTPLRREMNVMLLGLIAAAGLRLAEALHLRVDDLIPGGVLRIRHSKFSKSRLVPLHATVASAMSRYLRLRRRVHATNDYMFPSSASGPMHPSTVHCTFRRVVRLARIAINRGRRPRIHDLRHTFATRVLEQSHMDRRTAGEQFVALATYLGHVHPASTYWYLQATPHLMSDMAEALEALFAKEVA
jgi:integrase